MKTGTGDGRVFSQNVFRAVSAHVLRLDTFVTADDLNSFFFYAICSSQQSFSAPSSIVSFFLFVFHSFNL